MSTSKRPVTYRECFRYLCGHGDKYVKDTTKIRRRAIRRFATAKIALENGVLYYSEDGKKKRQWIEIRETQLQILQSVHDDLAGGCHVGRDKTREKVCSRYFWHNILEDVDDYVKTCSACQKANPKFTKTVSELRPIPIKSPWHRIGIDLIGPMPENPSGHKYVITCLDYYTKWAEAGALRNKSAIEAAQFLYSLFCRHGLPVHVMSDQGREFDNNLNKELFTAMGVNHIVSSAYHPQTNGLVERFNQTLQRSLLKMVGDNESDWFKYLGSVLFAYNTSRQASTKYSPFFLLYGRHPRLPVDLQVDQEGKEDYGSTSSPSELDLDVAMEEMIRLRKTIDTSVKENVSVAQERQKKQYNHRHLAGEYEIRDLVLLKNMRKLSRKGGKYEQNWSGPYEVAEKAGKGTYYLRRQGSITASKILYNSTRLKPFHERQHAQSTTRLPNHTEGHSHIATAEGDQSDSASSPSPRPDQSDKCSLNSMDVSLKPFSQGESVRDEYDPLFFCDNKQKMIDQLCSSSLMRLWRTGAGEMSYRVEEDDDIVDYLSSFVGPGEMSLSKDVNVALWLEWRDFSNKPEVKEAFDFVVVDDDLFTEFKTFKDKYCSCNFILLVVNELLNYWNEHQRKAPAPIRLLYGKPHIQLLQEDLDELCRWVYSCRSKADEKSNSLTTSDLADYLFPKAVAETCRKPAKPGVLSNNIRQQARKRRKDVAKQSACKRTKAKISQPIPILVDVGDCQHPTNEAGGETWIPELHLRNCDRDALLSRTAWLSDAVINAAQSLMKKARPEVGGFQDVLLGAVGAFSTETTEFVQILNTGRGHWHVVSTIGASQQQVHVYDSLHSACPTGSQLQIASLYPIKKEPIDLYYINVQRQCGPNDCGLFAIAFATSLVFEISPEQCLFDQQAMRLHLFNCFEKREITPFPVKKPRRPVCRVRCFDTLNL